VGASYPNQRRRGFPYGTNLRVPHTIIGFTVFGFSCAPLWMGFQSFSLGVMTQLLSASGIRATSSPSSEAPLLVIRLLDGSNLSLALTWQRCGLVSTTIFGLLLLFLVYPLEGPLSRKVVLSELGLLMGLSWSCIRIAAAILIAYHFGSSAFRVADFLTGPLTDVFWVVTVWSISLSALASKRCG
jgi:exosortase/archaeosortase family protein